MVSDTPCQGDDKKIFYTLIYEKWPCVVSLELADTPDEIKLCEKYYNLWLFTSVFFSIQRWNDNIYQSLIIVCAQQIILDS